MVNCIRKEDSPAGAAEFALDPRFHHGLASAGGTVFDWKYHVISLAAVFLALGLGLLLGTTLLGNDVLVQQQQKVIASLENNLQSLVQENRGHQEQLNALTKQLARYEEFSRSAAAFIAGQRLSGTKVAVATTADYPIPPEVASTLQRAGAEILSVTNFSFLTAGDQTWEAAVQEALASEAAEPGGEVKSLAQQVARGIAGTGQQGFLAQAQGRGLVSVSGAWGPAPDKVLIIGGSQKPGGPGEEIATALADYFLHHGIEVVAAETSTARSFTRAYRSLRVTTVDNVETPPGQAALVLALAGYQGHFGVKEGADGLLPPPPELAGPPPSRKKEE
ncbi:MAG: hypothetical protein D9V47_06405 [Clostridia bacterium]|nr:MAG: hypothetical protein D9V47_06405 [Clostridia bacterium]